MKTTDVPRGISTFSKRLKLRIVRFVSTGDLLYFDVTTLLTEPCLPGMALRFIPPEKIESPHGHAVFPAPVFAVRGAIGPDPVRQFRSVVTECRVMGKQMAN